MSHIGNFQIRKTNGDMPNPIIIWYWIQKIMDRVSVINEHNLKIKRI